MGIPDVLFEGGLVLRYSNLIVYLFIVYGISKARLFGEFVARGAVLVFKVVVERSILDIFQSRLIFIPIGCKCWPENRVVCRKEILFHIRLMQVSLARY